MDAAGLPADNFLQALFEPRFAGYSISRFVLNSILVAVVTSFLCVLPSAFVGYGFAKFRFRGRETLLWSMLSTSLLPFSSVTIPRGHTGEEPAVKAPPGWPVLAGVREAISAGKGPFRLCAPRRQGEVAATSLP